MLPDRYFGVMCCPACRSALSPLTDSSLSCTGCDNTYPIVDGVPVLLDSLDDDVSQVIKRYYDSAWKRDDAGTLAARVAHEDLSDRGQSYIHENEERFRSVFQNGAASDMFLDAGCGAQPRATFGASFGHHVCVDFSIDGLVECRKRLGDRAICLCGSLLKLPVRSSACAGVMAAHVIYHIDRDLQDGALAELSRVLTPGGTLLVLSANPQALEVPLINVMRSVTGRAGEEKTAFYYHAHRIAHMQQALRQSLPDATVSVRSLRMFSRTSTRHLFQVPVLGALGFHVVRGAERLFRRRPGLWRYVAYVATRE